MMLSVPLIALLAVGAPAAEAGSAAAIAPFLGPEVAVVIQADLAKIDAEFFVRGIVGKIADEEDLSRIIKTANTWIESLRNAGAKTLFVLLDSTDMPGMPLVVVPLDAQSDGQAITQVFSQDGPGRWPAVETIRGAVVAGTTNALTRIRQAKGEPEARPDVGAALTVAGGVPIRVAIVPSSVQRRAIEETQPNLPPALGGMPITTLTQGFRWASLTIRLGAKPTLQAVVQAKDAEAAKALRTLAENGVKLLVKQTEHNPDLGEFAKGLNLFAPELKGSNLILSVDLQKAFALVAVPIQKARAAALRSQCVNNLKQIALAMHNYHSAYNSFPPAFSASKDGKPLLSWRVHILPYLEQKSLYDQFKLDEPWDSPHNKPLIARMPAIYACPSGSRKIASEGKTTYLTPRGPATVFPGAEGIKIQEITDGTSNTIFVIDANDSSAVPWTKPDDWEIPTPFTTDGLFGHHVGGTSFAFADGSVRFIKETVSLKTLQALLTRNGGEVLSIDSF